MKTAFPRRLALATATTLTLVAANVAWSADPPAPASAATATSAEPVIVRATTRYGFDGTTLDARDRARILADVGKMKDVTWKTVSATGYTDSIGSAAYNERLSVRRAQSVKDYLVAKGLDAAMIETAGKAAASPVASNDTPAGRARNRRSEIEFRGVRTASR